MRKSLFILGLFCSFYLQYGLYTIPQNEQPNSPSNTYLCKAIASEKLLLTRFEKSSSMIRINFEDTYDIETLNEEMTQATFQAELKDGPNVTIQCVLHKIDSLPWMVYNLSFGPVDEHGKINDLAKIPHKNVGKLFSTILLLAIGFLERNPGFSIGIDGSNDARTYFYHRIFRSNHIYLLEYFKPLGIDWFVRLLRSGFVEKDMDGLPAFKPMAEDFNFARKNTDLYKYYLITIDKTKT